MIRKIIHIDENKCNGCGLCAKACHENAIGMVNGKAKLLRDDYCDGLGDCLPACPTGAITFVEREAAAYDEKAVEANKKRLKAPLPCGCPGSQMKTLSRQSVSQVSHSVSDDISHSVSQLRQWPVQIKLANINAPYFDGADLLIAADCTAYAYGNFHNDFIAGKITLIGCPKLDDTDYSIKLGEIIAANDIKSVTVVRMEVPCCGGIENAVRTAIAKSGRDISLDVKIISTDGRIVAKPFGF